MAFGVSFLPDGSREEGMGDEGNPRAQFQRAIQLLQLRLPRILSGGGQIAPAPLLNAMGGGGMNPNAALVQQAIAGMAGVPLPPSAPPAATPPNRPPAAPRVGAGQRRPSTSRPTITMPNPRATLPRVGPGIAPIPGPSLVPKGPVRREWRGEFNGGDYIADRATPSLANDMRLDWMGTPGKASYGGYAITPGGEPIPNGRGPMTMVGDLNIKPISPSGPGNLPLNGPFSPPGPGNLPPGGPAPGSQNPRLSGPFTPPGPGNLPLRRKTSSPRGRGNLPRPNMVKRSI